MSYERMIMNYINEEKRVLDSLDIDSIDKCVSILNEAFNHEKNIYIFGNGGSASTASHFENDFNKGISEYTQTKFKFKCLNDNVATLMAIANDIGYEEVFRFQLRGRLKKEDVVIAISGSGNSVNVINAVEYAKEIGAQVIGLTGYNGGKLKKMADISLHVPVSSMQITEDVHMFFDHMIMSIFYEILCGKQHLSQN